MGKTEEVKDQTKRKRRHSPIQVDCKALRQTNVGLFCGRPNLRHYLLHDLVYSKNLTFVPNTLLGKIQYQNYRKLVFNFESGCSSWLSKYSLEIYITSGAIEKFSIYPLHNHHHFARGSTAGGISK